ncbi:RNA polymerase sigma-70 factor [Dyadobacter sp. CY261]|uniref:RNA polymerase sigma-70 factor n=1 Tax=Dyadobacter sp. CY261 TaxID=2907203 RepID=UPI001F1CD9D3|nr:RNA polymerase sigma-70 factor [Dyadobacter sp. CY261]MCF0070968.1 RNA polymerase sigma-70 factor [Dyadobacter sp. CY261]
MQTFSEYSEEELLSLLTESNRTAFKQLYVSNYRVVFGYALKFIKSIPLAEDITQEVFLKIWENRETLPEIRHFKSYLLAICKNISLNFLARASRDIKLREQIVRAAEQSHEDTEHGLQLEAYETLLQEAIELLPPQRRLIFKLCKIEGKSYMEAALQLGIGAGTVNDHIVKGTRSIVAYLKKHNITLVLAIFWHFLKC